MFVVVCAAGNMYKVVFVACGKCGFNDTIARPMYSDSWTPWICLNCLPAELAKTEQDQDAVRDPVI